MISLPLELLDCILENLYHDKASLLSCALVEKAWVVPAQRGIFHILVLLPPDPDPYNDQLEALSEVYVKSTEQLVDYIDANPRLASYVRSLRLAMFCNISQTVDWEAVYTSTAMVIRRLSNVESLSLSCISWGSLSSSLTDSLIKMLGAPSVTRIFISTFDIPTFNDCTLLLTQATNLKGLVVNNMFCDDWALPENPYYLLTPPRLGIQLDELETDSTSVFASWFQQDSCPLQIHNLRSLKIVLEEKMNDCSQKTAFMLQQAGGSLRELQIQVSDPVKETDHFIHLGHSTNLNTLLLAVIQQPDSSPVFWIQSLFSPLLNRDKKDGEYSLLHFTIILYVFDDALETEQWDHWTMIDSLFEKPEFSPLEMVEIVITGKSGFARRSSAIVELLSRNLTFLKRSGKLKVKVYSR